MFVSKLVKKDLHCNKKLFQVISEYALSVTQIISHLNILYKSFSASVAY